MKLYYWRRGRPNPLILHVVFCNQEHRDGISAIVKPIPNGGWHYEVAKPFRTIEGTEPTQEAAQHEAETSIDDEFRPEYVPFFG